MGCSTPARFDGEQQRLVGRTEEQTGGGDASPSLLGGGKTVCGAAGAALSARGEARFGRGHGAGRLRRGWSPERLPHPGLSLCVWAPSSVFQSQEND